MTENRVWIVECGFPCIGGRPGRDVPRDNWDATDLVYVANSRISALKWMAEHSDLSDYPDWHWRLTVRKTDEEEEDGYQIVRPSDLKVLFSSRWLDPKNAA